MKSLLKRISDQRSLVIGDLMLDHYIWGDTTRISPEAPVPVVDIQEDTYRAGGAANVALNLRALNVQVELCGLFGGDEAGQKLLKLFSQEKILFDDSFVKAGLSTIIKTRVMLRKQQLCRLDREDLSCKYAMEGSQILGRIKEKIEKTDVLIFSDYAKGVLSQPMVDALLQHARAQGCFIAHDPKPRKQFNLRAVDLLTPNRAEALQLAGISLSAGEVFPSEELCRIIWERYHPHYLVVTMGGEGMLLAIEGKIVKQLPTYAREVFDVSGAGDTVVAVLAVALSAGASLEEAAHLANVAAGVVVAKVGTAVANPEEIIHYDAILKSKLFSDSIYA